MIIKICTECNNDFNAENNKIFLCCNICKNSYYKKVKEKRKNTCLDKYNCENPMQNVEVKEKYIKTCLDKYDVSNVSKNLDVIKKLKNIHKNRSSVAVEKIVNKRKLTCLYKYGTINPTQNEEVAEKISNTKNKHTTTQLKEISTKTKKTNLKKYGVENPMQNKDIAEKTSSTKLNYTEEKKKKIINKSIQTCQNKYGVNFSFQSKNNKEKSIKTCNKKYNCDYPMQNEKIFNRFQKSSYYNKSYILPSGKEIKIQGYENKYLDEYFKNGGVEDDIIIHPTQKDIGKIFYNAPDGKKHRYYPDFYISKDSLIIEVKSVWTMNLNLNINLLKEQSCINKGYNFEFKIYKPVNLRDKYD